jgi:two-component system response regulator VicR
VTELGSKKVLVVDDNKTITVMVQEMLRASTYVCSTANSGQECLDLIKDQDFDLILLDMAMPEMSGLDVLMKLKEHNMLHQNKAKVVLFTASPMYSEMDLRIIKEDYGVIERVKKPFTETELFALVKKHLG